MRKYSKKVFKKNLIDFSKFGIGNFLLRKYTSVLVKKNIEVQTYSYFLDECSLFMTACLGVR